jgi:hypothetical protein
MRRFFQPLSRGFATSGGNNVSSDTIVQGEALEQPNVGRGFNSDDIVSDPALRRQIEEYGKNVQDLSENGIYFEGSVPTKRFRFPSQIISSWFKTF